MSSPPQLPGATVLLTGALGFLGKVVLERLLASSKPARIFLLLRPKHGYSAQERLQHAKTRPCFAHLPPSAWDLVVALEGDTESPGLGLSAADAAAAAATTHVIHMAALKHSSANDCFSSYCNVSAPEINNQLRRILVNIIKCDAYS